jgi:hypothetical protein
MGRKPRIDRSPEEKWQIVKEDIKSGNVSEACRRRGIAVNLFCRRKDEAEQGANAVWSFHASNDLSFAWTYHSSIGYEDWPHGIIWLQKLGIFESITNEVDPAKVDCVYRNSYPDLSSHR